MSFIIGLGIIFRDVDVLNSSKPKLAARLALSFFDVLSSQRLRFNSDATTDEMILSSQVQNMPND